MPKFAFSRSDLKRDRTARIILILFLILILLVSAEFYIVLKEARKNSPGINSIKFVSLNNATISEMAVPAVDENGNGLVTTLVVEAMPGTGRTLVDIDNLLFWADTQHSIRLARLLAANLTSLDINKYDLIYSIHANATLIGGESAGASLTIATISALQNRKLNQSVMITGTINHDGSIGPVSEVIAKARAAKSRGAILFLVPLLQSRDIIYETNEHCEKFGSTEICSIEQLPKRIDIYNQTGINAVEIGSVKEALEYFFV